MDEATRKYNELVYKDMVRDVAPPDNVEDWESDAKQIRAQLGEECLRRHKTLLKPLYVIVVMVFFWLLFSVFVFTTQISINLPCACLYILFLAFVHVSFVSSSFFFLSMFMLSSLLWSFRGLIVLFVRLFLLCSPSCFPLAYDYVVRYGTERDRGNVHWIRGWLLRCARIWKRQSKLINGNRSRRKKREEETEKGK